MPELENPMAVALVVASVAVLIVGLLVLVRRNSQRKMEVLAPAFELGTARVTGMAAIGIQGLYHGFSCRYTLESASQYSPGGATLRLQATSPLEWSAGVADFGSRLMVRFGILKDLEIGDQELDGGLRFSSNDPNALLTLFGQERVRAAMRKLLDTETFNSIVVRPDRIDVKWVPRRPQVDENPDVLRNRLEATVALVTACGSSPAMEHTIG
jgi:hypothetical protein